MFIASIQAELRSDVQGRDDGKVKKTKNYYFKSEYQKKEVNTVKLARTLSQDAKKKVFIATS